MIPLRPLLAHSKNFTKYNVKHINFFKTQNCHKLRCFSQNSNPLVTLSSVHFKINVENSHAFKILEKYSNNDMLKTSLPLKLNLEDVPSTVSNLTDEELAHCLEMLSSKTFEKELFDNIWKSIDNECTVRFPNWSSSHALMFCMQFFKLGVAKSSKLVWGCLRKYCKALHKMSKTEVLQIMFLASICRQIPDNLADFDREFRITNHLNEMSLDEIAIVSLAFFKSQKKIKNKDILLMIINKLTAETESVHSYTLAMLSKTIAYSLKPSLDFTMGPLQEKLIKEIPRINVQSLTHIALMGNNILLCNTDLLRSIIDVLKVNIHEMRIKDMERILLVMAMYGIVDQHFIEEMCKQMHSREEEISKYPRAFISFVNYLLILNIYKPDLISKALCMKFIRDTYGGSYKNLGEELMYIDKSMEIEHPNYTGNRLDGHTTKVLAKTMCYRKYAETTNSTNKFSFAVEEILQTIYSQTGVAYSSILPHYCYGDYLIGFDKQKNHVDTIPSEWKIHRWGEVKTLPNHDCYWLTIITGNLNMYKRNTKLPVGLLEAKTRQLRKLGYYPVIISLMDWREQTNPQQYIKSLIDKKLSDIVQPNG